MKYSELYCKDESEVDPTPLGFAEEIKQIIEGNEFCKVNTQKEINVWKTNMQVGSRNSYLYKE